MTSDAQAGRKGRCPICGQETVSDYRPFCSRACANIDLLRWLKGGYAIAGGGPDADEDGDEGAARQARDPRPAGDEED
jgi:endogenous inhibitor of DNA gyrase (YacG/DUF329 family)